MCTSSEDNYFQKCYGSSQYLKEDNLIALGLTYFYNEKTWCDSKCGAVGAIVHALSPQPQLLITQEILCKLYLESNFDQQLNSDYFKIKVTYFLEGISNESH